MAAPNRRGGSGRKKIVIRRIEQEDARFVCYSKRRQGFFSKATDLAVLTGAQVAALAFSPRGRAFSFGHPSVCQNQREGRRERFCATLDFIDTKITRICSYTAQLNQTRTSRRNRAALTTNPTPLYMQYTRSLTPRRSRVVVRW